MGKEPLAARPQPEIQISNWGVRFGPKHLLKGITLSLEAPGITVLMGPVDAGKTILLWAIAGQMSSYGLYEGNILIRGVDTQASTPLAALVQQQSHELAFTVGEMLEGALRTHDAASTSTPREKACLLLHALGQTDLLPHMDSHLFTLPGPLLRRAQIIRAAATGSRVLLIDEPTTGLEPEEASDVLALIRQLARERCCLVVLRNQDHARDIADRVILLAGGRVQVDMEGEAFFRNDQEHAVLSQFLRTGNCTVPVPGDVPGDMPLDADDHAAAPVVAESQGPHGFHWLVPGRLAGCLMPGLGQPLEQELALLQAVGVTVLVNLTETAMRQPAVTAGWPRSIHIGAQGHDLPHLEWVKQLLARIEQLIAQGEVVAVHGLGGLARTGTVLGAWLIKEGLATDAALQYLRGIEPGFVQTRVQKEFLRRLEASLRPPHPPGA